MIKFTGIVIIVSCIVLFSDIIGFAQRNDLPNVSTSELSKMSKGHDGLISSTEMQAYHEVKPGDSVKGKPKNVSRSWKKTKTDSSSEPDTQVTGK